MACTYITNVVLIQLSVVTLFVLSLLVTVEGRSITWLRAEEPL